MVRLLASVGCVLVAACAAAAAEKPQVIDLWPGQPPGGKAAGGNLTAWTCTNFDKRAYEPIDDADKASCRPDFAVLVYPAYLVTKDADQLAPDIRVTKETPPMFLAHAGDDKIVPQNSVEMYL